MNRPYVTLAAARIFAGHTGLQIEAARKRLTQMMCQAEPSRISKTGAQMWRYRSRVTQLDITAHVASDGTLDVVTHIAVRDYL